MLGNVSLQFPYFTYKCIPQIYAIVVAIILLVSEKEEKCLLRIKDFHAVKHVTNESNVKSEIVVAYLSQFFFFGADLEIL